MIINEMLESIIQKELCKGYTIKKLFISVEFRTLLICNWKEIPAPKEIVISQNSNLFLLGVEIEGVGFLSDFDYYFQRRYE